MMPEKILAKLNEHQLQAVLDESPATLVNANVGSGKTTVLISKILYLHFAKGIPLKDMVVLTFTNKAAGEIKERITQNDPRISDADMSLFGTFHSVAMKLLQTILPLESLGFKADFTILDPDELTELATRLTAEHKLNIKYISKLDRRLEAYRSGNKLFGNMKNDDEIDELWKYIEEEKRRMNKLDFDDLIRYATQLFDSTLYSPKWIIIDEFQDTDSAQLALINRMASPQTKLFAVGDPNQVIYSWRGSNRNIFRDFSSKYHACEYSLPINYRSSSTILEAASSILGHNSGLSGIRDHGSKICIRRHYNAFNEAEYLVDKIKVLHDEGIEYNEIAVLYRMQKQSRSLEDSFRRAQIPYDVSARKTLKEIPVLLWFVQLLKASANQNDFGSMASVISNPTFGEGFTVKEAQKIASGKSKKTSMLRDKILGFKQWSMTSTDARDVYDYYDITSYLSPTSVRFEENKRYIQNFLNRFQEYITHKGVDVCYGLIEFINSSTLYGIDVLKEDVHIHENAVKLMTLHACKGLEFKYVFIVGANYGLIPIGSANPEDMEEEKRLFFVGITRTKDNLEISYYTSPDDQRVSPGASSYLGMIPPHLIEDNDKGSTAEVDLNALRREIAENKRVNMAPEQQAESIKQKKVRHKKYGTGIVESEDDETINVLFEAYGKKSFSKLFNPLEKVL